MSAMYLLWATENKFPVLGIEHKILAFIFYSLDKYTCKYTCKFTFADMIIQQRKHKIASLSIWNNIVERVSIH